MIEHVKFQIQQMGQTKFRKIQEIIFLAEQFFKSIYMTFLLICKTPSSSSDKVLSEAIASIDKHKFRADKLTCKLYCLGM